MKASVNRRFQQNEETVEQMQINIEANDQGQKENKCSRCIYNIKGNINYDIDNGLIDLRIRGVDYDSEGNIWVGTEGSGVFMFDTFHVIDL